MLLMMPLLLCMLLMPLGEFLDEQLARARENEIIESDDEDSRPRYELPIVPKGYVMDE